MNQERELIEKSKLESSRWEILRILDIAGWQGTTETVILSTLRAMWVDVTKDYVRNQLDYLANRDLIKLHKKEIEPWAASLDRYGKDVVSYSVECEPGIARPEKYW